MPSVKQPPPAPLRRPEDLMVAPQDIKRGRLPPGLRVYAIGDIHGRMDLLTAMLERIHGDIETMPPEGRVHIVFLGDYLDRGNHSKSVIDYLISWPQPHFEVTFLRGNHEATMLQFLTDLTAGPGWLTYGGVNTLLSYGVRPPVDVPPRLRLAAVQTQLRATLPTAHVAFLRHLSFYTEIGSYLFVHAGIRPGVPLDQQRHEDLVWIREDFLSSTADHGWVVVHGHTITMEAESLPNRIGIDTGAYATGRLTAVVLENEDRRFIDTAL